MNWHKSRWVLLIFGIITLSGVGYILIAEYARHAKGSPVTRPRYDPQIMDKPLPEARLADASGVLLQDDELRCGKVILVLLSSECGACLKDGQFLEAVIVKHRNIRFYGALLFWSEATADQIKDKFPMKLFYDEDSLLRHRLRVTATPMKIYLYNGMVKKVWVGTPTTPQAQSMFIKEVEEIASK